MDFQKLKLTWKILKFFTSPKQQSVRRKLFNPAPDKRFLRLWNKNIRTDVYGTFFFQLLWECSSLASRNGTVQMLFLTPARNMFLVMLQEYITYNVDYKLGEAFWEKLYYKMSNYFCQFLLALRLSTRKSEISR